ncbi:MAG: polysaccharide deacetylase family protein [Ignavibacteriaceae bacterium]
MIRFPGITSNTFSLFFIVLFSFSVFSQPLPKEKSKVAVTIDDLPFSSYRALTMAEKNFIYDQLIIAFEKNNIKALCFVIGNTYKPADEPFLKRILTAGHQLGNHTFSHSDYNSVSFEQYSKDIQKCDDLLKKFNVQKKYFRFPYLTEGNSKEKVESIYSFFSKNQISPVPVSLFCTDVNFSQAFERAYYKNDKKEMDRIAAEYLADFKKNSKVGIEFARTHTRKNPGHVLLFHMNLLSAYTIQGLINICKENNLEFVHIDEILKEEWYKKPPRYFGGAGYTLFERL